MTKEMQGVRVSGMIVWSIKKNNDGPFKAYKNLGDDLASGSPRTANLNIASVSEAIVRDAIAHSTLIQILKCREELSQKIRKEMSDVVNGWGVWLEAVEITDVRIQNAQMFQDMQAEYREKMRLVASAYEMKIKSELGVIKSQKEKEMEIFYAKNTLE